MPASPYPISGTIYDTDNSTAKASVNMLAYNVTTGESISTTSSDIGEYVLDLANFTSGYSSGDVIFISGYVGDVSIDYRTTTTAGDATGGSESKDLYLMWGSSHAYFDAKLLAGLVTNTAGSMGYVKFYDRKNDTELVEVRVPANDSKLFNFMVSKRVEGLCMIPSANTMKASIQADI